MNRKEILNSLPKAIAGERNDRLTNQCQVVLLMHDANDEFE